MAVSRLLPKMTTRDEAELRVFYASCGLSPRTIEAAIEARRKPPADPTDEKKAPQKGRFGRAVRLPLA